MAGEDEVEIPEIQKLFEASGIEDCAQAFARRLERKYGIPPKTVIDYLARSINQCIYVFPKTGKQCDHAASLEIPGTFLCYTHRKYDITKSKNFAVKQQFKKNKFGNFWDPETNLVFKNVKIKGETSARPVVVGFQLPSGQVRKLTPVEIEVCEKRRYFYAADATFSTKLESLTEEST